MNSKNETKKKSESQPKSRKFRQFGNLVMSYYPDRGYKRAVALFREELRRVLSPRLVRVIEEYLGEV